MRPKGIWIAIGLILAVGISSTRLVRQYTSEPLRMNTAETVMADRTPEPDAFPAERIPEEASERTVRIPEAAMAQIQEPEQEAETEAAAGYGQALDTEAVPEQASDEAAASEEAPSAKQSGKQDILERLEELDRQIEKKRSSKQDATANSAKAVAESERKLWENELNQLLSGLRSHMSPDTWDAFMKDQNEWIRSREAMAVEALSGNSGSVMKELEYTRSLTEITRDRAYELAEEYHDVLSETE